MRGYKRVKNIQDPNRKEKNVTSKKAGRNKPMLVLNMKLTPSL